MEESYFSFYFRKFYGQTQLQNFEQMKHPNVCLSKSFFLTYKKLKVNFDWNMNCEEGAFLEEEKIQRFKGGRVFPSHEALNNVS